MFPKCKYCVSEDGLVFMREVRGKSVRGRQEPHGRRKWVQRTRHVWETQVSGDVWWSWRVCVCV